MATLPEFDADLEPLTDIHRGFLQYIMAGGCIRRNRAGALLQHLFQTFGDRELSPEHVEAQLDRHIETLNKALNHVGMMLASVRDVDDLEQRVVFVNLESDLVAQQALPKSGSSKRQAAFARILKNMCDRRVDRLDHVATVTELESCLGGSTDDAERFLVSLIEDGWLKQNGHNLQVTARFLLELRPLLEASKIPRCGICHISALTTEEVQVAGSTLHVHPQCAARVAR